MSNCIVNIVDKNLLKIINKNLERENLESAVTVEDMKRLIELNLDCKGVYDLTGIEYAVNLKKLIISNIMELDTSALTKLTHLKYLHIECCNLTNEDIKVLENLTNLEYLSLKYNKISDISVLRNLHKLEELTIIGSNIEDISPLSNLTSLKYLNLSGNKIKDISAMNKLVSLKIVNLDNNQISSVPTLEGLNNLKLLKLTRNNIHEIGYLGELKSLDSLYLSKNHISDVSALKPYFERKLSVSVCEQTLEVPSLKSLNLIDFFNGKDLTITQETETMLKFKYNKNHFEIRQFDGTISLKVS